jgi:hypothetical protein
MDVRRRRKKTEDRRYWLNFKDRMPMKKKKK